jgi:acyl-CoA synthetase (AMP-forming)/AMP-acid ligase II
MHVHRGMPLPDANPSVLDAIDRHAAEKPEGRALVFPDGGRTMSWKELRDSARRAAGSLRAAGVERGDLVGVMLRNDERFVPAVLGTWCAGAAAAPVPIPGAFADVDVFAEHISGMAAAAGLQHVLYDPSLPNAHTEAAVHALPGLRWIDVAEVSTPLQERAAPLPIDLALVSYTSGSTSAPRGVELTHANVTSAVAAFAIATGLGPDDGWGIWTPLFHDFALISMLTSLWVGAAVWVWSPTQFIRNPGRWLAEFGRSGVTHYSGPNFSFDLMHDSTTADVMAGVSLGAWRVAVSGGEMVSAATVRRFTERFAPYGFRPETIVPGYGLAEVTLGVAVPQLGTRPRVITVSREGLTGRRRVEPVPAGDPSGRPIVSVGRPFPGMTVRIAGEDGDALPEGQVGEIEVAGPSITRGYRGQPDATRDGWFKTGDLGFVDGQDLFVCGRIKDVVNVRGTKYHPEDLEPIVAEVEGVRKGRCCIVGEGETDEHMAVIVETRLRGLELAQLRAEIHERLVRRLGMGQIRVYLVKPRTIQVTSNGKVRRQLMRRLLESGELTDLEDATTPAVRRLATLAPR